MKEKIKEIIQKAIIKLGCEVEDVNVEIPNNRENGDFSTNIALKLAKKLQMNPITLAGNISQEIKDASIVRVEVKAPGFINIFIDRKEILNIINYVLQKGEKYGENNIGNGKKVNIEFVSANPTGIIHMGNARGGAYGDNLARIMTFSGYNVTKEYYVNDAGGQIDNLALSIIARCQEILGKNFEMPEGGYYGQEIITIAEDLVKEHLEDVLNKDITFFKEYGTNKLLTKIKKDLEDYRVIFDVFTSELAIRRKGNIPQILKKLKENGYTYELDKAIWFKTSEFGDEKDHVLVKSDGEYTYLVPDIDYHIDKINRGFDELIDVLGTDHHGYVTRLKASLEALGYNKDILEVKLLQLVRLIKDNQEMKMSKRTGNSVSLSELINEVGVDAARYFFASKSLDTQMDFDLDLAKKTTNENPFYYVSYAYARISSILKNNPKSYPCSKYGTIDVELAYNVLEKISLFENIVKDAALKKLPHLITNYVYDLATTFHTFYEKYRFISDDEVKTNENLNVLKAIRITIENALKLIGVKPPEKM